MLILLPPSESKDFGTKPSKLNLSKLSFPELSENREILLNALIKLSKSPKKAQEVLGISAKQISEVESNASLLVAKTSPAISIYSGVLFDAFDYQGLAKPAKARADKSVIITSSLFGLLRLQDHIPHYRLSGDVVLPKIGGVAKSWQAPIELAMANLNTDLLIDMRSGNYAKFWQPAESKFANTVVIKIMSRTGTNKNAKKIAISHNNKATKGHLAKDLVSLAKSPKNIQELIDRLQTLGWECELQISNKKPATLEVFI